MADQIPPRDRVDVPGANLRLPPPEVTRVVAKEANERVWDLLGEELAPIPGRRQHGTAYALWLIPGDLDVALATGARTTHEWSNGSITDLAERAGPGWIWGSWNDAEPTWARHAYDAGGPGVDT
jgi:hypothetical protein